MVEQVTCRKGSVQKPKHGLVLFKKPNNMKYILLFLSVITITAFSQTPCKIYGDASVEMEGSDTVYFYPRVQPADGPARPVKYLDLAIRYDSISGSPNGGAWIEVSATGKIWRKDNRYFEDVWTNRLINGTANVFMATVDLPYPVQYIRIVAVTFPGRQKSRLSTKWSLVN